MNKLLVIALATALLACSSKKSTDITCSQHTDCPAGNACVAGVCSPGTTSGGSYGTVSGSARLTAGTKTMDVVVGQAVTSDGTGGTKTMAPAENTR